MVEQPSDRAIERPSDGAIERLSGKRRRMSLVYDDMLSRQQNDDLLESLFGYCQPKLSFKVYLDPSSFRFHLSLVYH